MDGSQQPLADVTLVILCGGGGRRMGGVDKPLELLDRRPLIDHVVTALGGAVAATVISCNRNADHYRQWGETVADVIPGAGPLAGVHAALGRVRTPFAMIVPGDAPRVGAGVVRLLRHAIGPAEAAWVVAGGREECLFVLVRAAVRPRLDEWLRQGGRTVRHWLHAIDGLPVAIDRPGDWFANVNSVDDLRALDRSQRPP